MTDIPPAWIPVPASLDRIPDTILPWGLGTVSASVVDVPASFVLLDLGYQVGVSVIVPDELAGRLVTLDVTDRAAQGVFERIGAQFGFTALLSDGVVSFVPPDLAAFEFTAFRPGFLLAPDALQAVRTVVGKSGEVSVMGGRLVVTGDRAAVERAIRFRDQFEVGADGWVFEVRVVQLTQAMRRTVGLDWTLEARASVGGGLGSPGPLGPLPVVGLQAEFIANVLAKATQSGRDAVLVNTATLFVLEGSTSELQQGDVVPVPQFQTSPEGTTTTTGFTFINTGLSLSIGAERVPGGVRLRVEPELSSVSGFVREAPVVATSSVSVSVVMESGSWVVISGLDAFAGSSSRDGVPGLPASWGMESLDVTDSSLLFLLRAERVYSAAGGE